MRWFQATHASRSASFRASGRNYLAHRQGDFNNAVLAAVGYNFRRLIKWLRILLRVFLAMLLAQPNALPA